MDRPHPRLSVVYADDRPSRSFEKNKLDYYRGRGNLVIVGSLELTRVRNPEGISRLAGVFFIVSRESIVGSLELTRARNPEGISRLVFRPLCNGQASPKAQCRLRRRQTESLL